MRWFERQRRAWLEARRAPFRRKHLEEAFEVSTVTASKDIQKFLRDNPGMWEYNLHTKRYERTA